VAETNSRRIARGNLGTALLTVALAAGIPTIDSPTTGPAVAADDWPMAAANPQRTSWTPHEVAGVLRPQWYRRFEPYISQKVQIIAAHGSVFVATARGLYALDAETGRDRWVYPTALPLGHSPTVADGAIYVGGFDRRLHALDVWTGKLRWTFAADAGFQTNPLAVAGLVIAGNRDGSLYAVDARTGRLRWKFATGGPVLFSPAYRDGVVYFAANNSHAYAVDAATGREIWKSAKLPGAGFHSWWPVVHEDRVILAGSENYSNDPSLSADRQFLQYFRSDLFPGEMSRYDGVNVGPTVTTDVDWSRGRTVLDLSRSNQGSVPVTEYFEQKPWRRTYFVLDRRTGTEISYDFDADGKPEYAPLVHCGTQTGNRYPPVISPDGILYQDAAYRHSGGPIPRGGVIGWKMDTPLVGIVNEFAVDEPLAYSLGGSLLYHSLCVSRVAGADDLRSGARRGGRYFNYNLENFIPDIYSEYSDRPGRTYGGRNGYYGLHGDQNPPIPYGGKAYLHRCNYLIAFAAQGDGRKGDSVATASAAEPPPCRPKETLRLLLTEEIEKILAAGHLRPGYTSAGFFDQTGGTFGRDLGHYFSDPSETIIILTRASPFVPAELRERLKTYLRSEFARYPPHRYSHIGWRDGAPREVFDTPPEVQSLMSKFGPSAAGTTRARTFSPLTNYALFQYAQAFGESESLLAFVKPVGAVPADENLLRDPALHNGHIADLEGVLGLARLAGRPEPAEARAQLEKLLQLRSDHFSGDVADHGKARGGALRYQSALNGARNFLFLTPGLARHLREQAAENVRRALTDYERRAPYWFVAQAEEGYGESALVPLHHYHAVFQAKALILNEPYSELEKYIDVPAFQVGDLFYIDNLVSALAADER
jgi:outer membrane protein assembly factor BamB